MRSLIAILTAAAVIHAGITRTADPAARRAPFKPELSGMELSSRALRKAIIQSETGRLCRVQKPCPGQAIRVLDTDTGVEVLHTTDPRRSDCVVFNTERCRAYELKVVTNQP